VVINKRGLLWRIFVCEGDKAIRKWRKLLVQDFSICTISGSIRGMIFKKNDMDGFCV
jgi:hypothetical protein